MVLNHSNILNKFGRYKIDAFAVSTDINKTNAFHFDDLDDFILFVKKQSINVILYSYTYLDEEALIIDNDVISKLKLNPEMIGVIQSEIDEYNSKVEKLDFSTPITLTIYCVFDGIVCFTEIYDYWFQEQGFDHPEIVLIKIAEKNFDKMVNGQEEANKIRENKLIDLKERILSDSKFYNCTNIQLRRDYTYKMLNSDEVKELFYHKNGAMRDVHPITFVEEIWREHKANSKSSKS